MKTRGIKDHMDPASSITAACSLSSFHYKHPSKNSNRQHDQSSTVERYCPEQTMKPNPWFLTTSALLYAYKLQSFSSHVKHQEPDVEQQLV